MRRSTFGVALVAALVCLLVGGHTASADNVCPSGQPLHPYVQSDGTQGVCHATDGDIVIEDASGSEQATLDTGASTLALKVAVSGLTGLTVASGGITATAGGVTITAGGLTVTAGGVDIDGGGIDIAAGGMTNVGAVSGVTTLGMSGDLTCSADVDLSAAALADGDYRVSSVLSGADADGTFGGYSVTIDNSAGTALTSGSIVGVAVTPTGHASDSGGTYGSFFASDATDSGGAASYVGLYVGDGYDECVVCSSGTIDGLDPNPVDDETDYLGVRRLAKGTLDCTGGEVCDVADSPVEFGPELPDNARVVRCWYEVRTTFTDGDDDSATIALGFATDDAGGILAAVAISDGGNPLDAGLHDGIQDGAAANFGEQLTDSRKFIAEIADDDIDAGVLDLFCEYYVGQ